MPMTYEACRQCSTEKSCMCEHGSRWRLGRKRGQWIRLRRTSRPRPLHVTAGSVSSRTTCRSSSAGYAAHWGQSSMNALGRVTP
jgi:hypothetical protein